MRPIWIIGAGGHAKVVIDTLRTLGTFDVLGVLDDDPLRLGTDVLRIPVRGDVSHKSIDRFGIEEAIIAIGSNRARAAVAGRLADRVSWATAIHPTAHLAPGVRIGEGTVVFAGAIVQPSSVVGRHVILNTACSVDHDGSIGDFVHMAPGVRLAGNVQVGEGALLGIGCSVIPERTIGAWATIGAGGVVVDDIPPDVTAKGIPATSSEAGSTSNLIQQLEGGAEAIRMGPALHAAIARGESPYQDAIHPTIRGQAILAKRLGLAVLDLLHKAGNLPLSRTPRNLR